MITSSDLQTLIADTEAEILRVIAVAEDPATVALYDQIRYHLGLDGGGSGGKRIRPLLGLLAYQALAGRHEPALPGAAAVELGHNFSLVHDDIQDGSVERRHRAALWTLWGVPQAINTGDALFTLSRLALHRLRDLGFEDAKVLDLMRLYDETCLALCEGQFLDLASAASDELQSVDAYFDMIGRKTAALIAGAVQAGAMLATDDGAVIRAFRTFGWSLGIAFQLNDDLLGIWGEEAATGKEATDLAERKKTLPVLYAREQAGPEDREALEAFFRRSEHLPGEVDAIRALLERTGAREYARREARRFRDEALAALDGVRELTPGSLVQLRGIVVSAISA